MRKWNKEDQIYILGIWTEGDYSVPQCPVNQYFSFYATMCII